MKTWILTAVACWIASVASAYETYPLPVKKAVIYNNGGTLTLQTQVPINAGSGELVFYPIPAQLETNSMIAAISNQVQVMGLGIRPWNPQNQALIDRLNKQADSIQLQLERLLYKRDVYVAGVSFLNNNRSVSSEYDGIKLDFVRKVMDVFRAGKGDVYAKVNQLDLDIVRLYQLQREVEQQLEKEKGLANSGQSELFISYASERKLITAEVRITTFCNSISWLPRYDVIAKGDSLVFKLKAEIFQRTGVDFNAVSVFLSNGQPKTNQDLPVLNTVYFSNAELVTGSASKRRVEAVPESQIAVVRSTTWLDAYNPRNIRFPEVIFSNGDAYEQPSMAGVGYKVVDKEQRMEIAENRLTTTEIRKSATRSVANLAVTGSGVFSSDDGEGLNIRGGREEQSAYFVEGIRMRGSASLPKPALNSVEIMSNYNEVRPMFKLPADQLKEQILEFAVPGLVDVPSTFVGYMVAVNETTIPVNTYYQVYPSLSNRAWCVANLTQREQYNLLHANATFYANGICTGKADFDPDLAEDTLAFSIGKVNDILVDKKQQNVTIDRKVIAGKCVYTITYSITVKNMSAGAKSISVEERYPKLGGNPNGVVLNAAADAEIDEKEHAMVWNFMLGKGESKVMTYTYTVTL